MQKLQPFVCKLIVALSIVLNVIMCGLFAFEKVENTYLRIIIGVYGQEVPMFVNSDFVIKLTRDKADMCKTEISLVDDYGKMSVNKVIKLAGDIKKVRTGDMKIATN